MRCYIYYDMIDIKNKVNHHENFHPIYFKRPQKVNVHWFDE